MTIDSKDLIIVGLLIWVNICAAIVEAYVDSTNVKNKKLITHLQSAIIRACFWVAPSLIYLWFDFWAIFWLVMTLATNYWLVFDYAYNRFFGHDWDYNSESSNWMDQILNFLSRGNKWVKLTIKLVAFGGCLTAYFLVS